MTFNKKPEINLGSSHFTPLLEDSITNQLNRIEEKFVELSIVCEDAKAYNHKLSKMEIKEYAEAKPAIHTKLAKVPEILTTINDIISRVSNSKISDDKLKNISRDKIRIVEERIITKNQEISRITNEIIDKESNLFSRYSNPVDLDISSHNDRNKVESLNESNLVLKDVVANKEYIQLREKEMLEIKKISAQVASITKAMSADVERQRQAIGSLEDNIIDVKNNVVGAENEIGEAERMTRGTTRRIFWMFLSLCFVVLAIITIVVLIWLGNDKK